MTLTPSQWRWLRWIDENGGEATVEGQYVVCLRTNERSSVASAICFLHLLSRGALCMRGGRIVLSDYGRRLLKP